MGFLKGITKPLQSVVKPVSKPFGSMVGKTWSTTGTMTRDVTEDVPVLKNVGSGVDRTLQANANMFREGGAKGNTLTMFMGINPAAGMYQGYKDAQADASVKALREAQAKALAQKEALDTADQIRQRDAYIKARQDEVMGGQNTPGRPLFTSLLSSNTKSLLS